MSILKNYTEGKTQLNKLKYGTFNVGNEPIIQKTIPSTIEEQGEKSTQGSKRGDDLARITSLMTRAQGLTYLSNEAQLGRVRIKGKAQEEQGSSLLGNLVGGSVNAARVLGSTLAQVPVNGTGIHFIKGFESNSHYLGRNYAGEVKEGSKVGINPNFVSFPQSVNFKSKLGPGWNPEKGIVSSQNGKRLSSTDVPDNETNPGADAISLENEIARQLDTANNIENRVGLGNIGIRPNEERNKTNIYSKTVSQDQIDRINALEPFVGRPADFAEITRDLVKFRFEVIDSDNTGQNTFLVFRALIDSIDDNHSADWTTTNYIGRGEPFYNYLGSQRSVNISFKVAAITRHELKPIYNKLNNLISTTSPTYNKDGFMRGTFTKLTVGSFFYELPGFVESLDLSWNTTYPWEIAMTEPDIPDSDDDVQELPMVLDVSLSFKPVHNFIPETGNKPFLTRHDKPPFEQ